ncbi:L-2-hydroxyglutarate oxidase LhgO [Micromonospora viridifaciens]|uniref:L-2-hydroxyglutarate oxidase LhgO n=1 Tax=Micromonospora viridifaciens TaxID=1881 RepID=A0A1C4XH03_MICVI|nr:L-2-hydroxyglutarate oxidase [Micromonospora viridifaciens]SCF07612.1 L-2-hydroxyglutarate oxidase LhgO [Micromonospora viridifaciens]
MSHVVVGAGIVGLAVARELLLRRPGSSVVVLDKERQVGLHQTGHNSGVVHAGVYYQPGSLKATLCRRGVALLREYTAEHDIAYQELGKVIVARNTTEQARLADLLARARANGVPDVQLLGPDGLRDREPHARGVAALLSPHTAVVDFGEVARSLAADVARLGGEVRLGAAVTGIARRGEQVLLATANGQHVVAEQVILCAGLHVDRLAALAGGDPSPRILPFRGEYYRLRPERSSLVRGLIYPVPDPRYPFLGVHLTRRVDGTVDVGPNAVLALAREGYRRRDVRLGDLLATLGYPGFPRLAARHWRTGARELLGSLLKGRFVAAARHYVPELTAADLVRAPAGVRAQAVDRRGDLVDDFRIEIMGRVVAVRNAPSPAATSSLAIAEHVVERALAAATERE